MDQDPPRILSSIRHLLSSLLRPCLCWPSHWHAWPSPLRWPWWPRSSPAYPGHPQRSGTWSSWASSTRTYTNNSDTAPGGSTAGSILQKVVVGGYHAPAPAPEPSATMGNGHDSDEEAEALLLRYRVASALVDGERMADRWDVTAGATR